LISALIPWRIRNRYREWGLLVFSFCDETLMKIL
jgi:hypothetical protein